MSPCLGQRFSVGCGESPLINVNEAPSPAFEIQETISAPAEIDELGLFIRYTYALSPTSNHKLSSNFVKNVLVATSNCFYSRKLETESEPTKNSAPAKKIGSGIATPVAMAPIYRLVLQKTVSFRFRRDHVAEVARRE